MQSIHADPGQRCDEDDQQQRGGEEEPAEWVAPALGGPAVSLRAEDVGAILRYSRGGILASRCRTCHVGPLESCRIARGYIGFVQGISDESTIDVEIPPESTTLWAKR
jgi:hypothetical protein